MYYNEFDFINFFDDKYKNARTKDSTPSSSGIGAIGIITHNQMVIRINEPDLDAITDHYVPGLGHHYDEESLIFMQMYDILGKNFNQLHPETYENINKDIINQILCGNIRLRMINNETLGNTIIIELPLIGKISSNQIRALEKLDEMIEDTCIRGKILINIMILIGNDEIHELNTIRNKILPRIKELVDDTYEPIIEDKIIVDELIDDNKLHL